MECKVCNLVHQRELDGWELPEIQSSPKELEVLDKSVAWQDVRNTLIAWLIKGRDDLEEMGEGYDRNAISALQGGNAMIRTVLHLPSVLAKLKEDLNVERAGTKHSE